MERTQTPRGSSPARRRPRHRRPLRPLVAGLALLAASGSASAPAGDVPRAGLVDQGPVDPRLKGLHAAPGFSLELVAEAGLTVAPAALACDDAGRAYVAETTPAARSFDVWDAVTLDDGSKARVRRRRQATSDVIRRLDDRDGDGKFDAAEVVVEGVERPTALLWIKGSLYVASLGRLERWDDADGDGRFETRTTLVDGLGALDDRGVAGLTLGVDGWLYLAVGDNPTHAFTPAGGSRVDLARAGGLLRCRLDGTELQVAASGFRRPRGGVAFDADARPILVDDDGADGSRLAGVRLVRPSEGGDYGYRSLGDAAGTPDHDLGTVDGDRPGRLGGFARLNHVAPASILPYGGTALPEVCRGLLIAADPERHAVTGIKLAQAGAATTLAGEAVLVAGDDESFRPVQVVAAADSTLYILDAGPAVRPEGGDRRDAGSPGGRIYRLAGTGAVGPFRKWEQLAALTTEQLLFQALPGPDHGAADRAVREVVDRGPGARATLLAYAANATQPVHARLLGIQGARQMWSDEVEEALANLLVDPSAEVRCLAAEALAIEPKRAKPPLVSRLLDRLEDADPRVVRAVALAIGRHAEINPRQPAASMVRWLYSHPKADPLARDGILRGLERLGDVGVDEVALAVRTRRGLEREAAIGLYAGLRSSRAADELTGLVKIPDLSGAERAALIRQFADFPPEPPVATTGLVDWMVKHPEADALARRAALAVCRYAGNPASALVLAALDAEDEEVRIAAARFAARTRPPGSMGKLAAILGDAGRAPAERLAAAEGLAEGGSAAFPALDAAFLAAEDPALRRAVLRSLAAADPAKARPALASTLVGPDAALRAEAVDLLGATPDGAVAAGRAYLDGTLGRADLPGVLRALRRHDGKDSRATLAAVVADATRGKSALSASALKLRAVEAGNPWSGLAVFEGAAARCASCHAVGGRGGKAGPALDLDAHGLTAEAVIDSILRPSHTIKPGYEPARLALVGPRDGETKPNPADRAARSAAPLAGVDRDRIAADPARHPAMPEGLDLDLTPQELADLVAFLLDAPAQAALRAGGVVPLDRWVAAGPFAPGADSLRVPLDRVDLARPLVGDGGRPTAWSPLVAAPDGRVNLGGLVGADVGQAYAAAEVRSPAAQDGWLYASTRGATRVYLNGVRVAEAADRSAGAGDDPAGATHRDFVRLNLKAGANLILVAFDRPARGEPTATFRVAAARPVEARLPRAAEGSAK